MLRSLLFFLPGTRVDVGSNPNKKNKIIFDILVHFLVFGLPVPTKTLFWFIFFSQAGKDFSESLFASRAERKTSIVYLLCENFFNNSPETALEISFWILEIISNWASLLWWLLWAFIPSFGRRLQWRKRRKAKVLFFMKIVFVGEKKKRRNFLRLLNFCKFNLPTS